MKGKRFKGKEGVVLWLFWGQLMIPKLKLKPKPSSFSLLIFLALFFSSSEKTKKFHYFFLLSSPFLEEKKENGGFLAMGFEMVVGVG